MSRAVLGAVALGLLASGCFRTTVRSGHPPAAIPPGYDERWHSGWLAGIAEASGPHRLQRLCPEGWAEVKAKTDPLGSLLTYLTLTIYTPQSVTVVCAEPGAPGPPPREGYAPAALPSSSAYPAPRPSGYPPPPPPPDEL